MNNYQTTTEFNCGIDLHGNCMYICVTDRQGKILLNKNIRGNDFSYFEKLITPWKDNLTVACESTFNWYILADFCESKNIKFALGHAQNMKLIHGAKAKNDKIDSQKIAHLLRSNLLPKAYVYPNKYRSMRDLIRRRLYFVRERAALIGYISLFERRERLKISSRAAKKEVGIVDTIEKEIVVDRYTHLSLKSCSDLIQSYNEILGEIEKEVLRGIKKDKSKELSLLKSAPGIGNILGMTIFCEVGDFNRFENVKQFSSYCRLIRCKAESAGKTYGTIGHKKGNPNLKWAFSEMGIQARHYPQVKAMHTKLLKKHSKVIASSILRHKLGRAVYFMMTRQEPFKWENFTGCTAMKKE